MSKTSISCRLTALVLLLLSLLSLVLSSCGTATSEGDGKNGNIAAQDASYDKQTLQILKSDYTFSQEQKLSRIKAEYLLANNGYRDDDVVVAILSIGDDSLTERYLASGASGSVAEFAVSAEGTFAAEEIRAAQDAMIASLKGSGMIRDVRYRYSTVLNAIAVETTYENFLLLSEDETFSRVILSDTFNLPKAESTGTDASVIENAVDVYETGIFNSGSVDYTGKGTAVAILDSGFDLEHSVFEHMPDCSEDKLLITDRDVSQVLPDLTANKLMHGNMELYKAYINRKVPYVFDYADKDQDVRPYDSEHGTHVAGIIGGLDSVITGVAVDTQLVLMKVFPDLDEGGKTEDIVAALEDAVLLGVDAINMSLGSSCGFAREADNEALNNVYDRINEAGISLICAASNDYSSAFGGAQGNTNKVTNPDSATVGSPSTYAAALSVASISGTKSKYMVANGTDVVFFEESNAISGKPNNFFAELYAALGKDESETLELTYVTIPGIGVQANYLAFDEGYLNGKIALVQRGDSTFEDKALQAKNAGAIACIIYNNIEGSILMSMGKTDHIPTISITRENGVKLAERPTGTITVSMKNQAGPFMSDFSSWGPSPNLELKPEITAHGGNIKSAVPNGKYDELSGTSMATPNMTGIVLLIRQYLKEKYPTCSPKEISDLCNQILMSTATIVINEEGNPYSPRKQGAGLASLKNVVTTSSYLTVTGKDRTKLELGDDPARGGIYEMEFNVVNMSSLSRSYTLGLIGMTETVSGSDATFVAEKDQILAGSTVFSLVSGDGTLSGTDLTVGAGATVTVHATYTLTDGDREMIDRLFPYGMYVEGFVTLTAKDDGEVDLNIPFLAFYGDWTQAPLFDKTYYEVESEAHDMSIDEEDKIKADYLATTPYGSYFYNYIIPLGTYLYDVDTSMYDAIPGSIEHAAISNELGTIDGISAVYAGLLRNAKTMVYTIVDKVTGETVKSFTVKNSTKAHPNGGTPIPNYEYLRWKTYDLELVNNHQYEFTMTATLDFPLEEGRTSENVRDTFTFDFYVDTEAPVLKKCVYEKVYDKAQKKDRFYLTLTVYDNHYAQSVTPILFTSSSAYTLLTENPIPIYSEFGSDTTFRFEITDILADVGYDAIMQSGISFSIDDYALNSNIYICQLPGTDPLKGEKVEDQIFRFTKDGTLDGSELTILSLYEDEVVDLTRYLATGDPTLDEGKDYLKYLVWESSNEKVAVVEKGQIRGIKAGKTTVTVTEQMNLRSANLLINVKARDTAKTDTEDLRTLSRAQNSGTRRAQSTGGNSADATKDKIESARFTYFDTLFAYSRAAQTSEIGTTGSRIFISSLSGGGVSMYPGEKIKLSYEINPWYVENNYELSFVSSNNNILRVSEDGTVEALKKGSATVTLKIAGSNLSAKLKVTVNSEFVIENRTLIAYKGNSEHVVIPDDEGILYIGAYAFCLYTTDNMVELSDDDYDANKLPQTNPYIKSVVIPDSVEEIQKYAFYNCPLLESVTLPASIKNIREYAFFGDVKLREINLDHVQVIGHHAFSGCKALDGIDLSDVFAIGANAFKDCTALSSVDLTSLRNSGAGIFVGCTALKDVVMTEKTQLSEQMFAKSGIETADIYATLEVPTFCFAQCDALTRVVIHNDLWRIAYGAFCQCDLLSDITFSGSVDIIAEQAFYDCPALLSVTLPSSPVTLENYAFFRSKNLGTIRFAKDTELVGITGVVLEMTNVTTLELDPENTRYRLSADGKLLLDSTGNTVVFSAPAAITGEYTVPYLKVGDGAMAGIRATKLIFTNQDTVIGKYAFANARDLETVEFPAEGIAEIGDHAFRCTALAGTTRSSLSSVTNLDKITKIGAYAFSGTALPEVRIAANAEIGEAAFFESDLENVVIGENAVFGVGAFQDCKKLKTVEMPEGGGVRFGVAAFARDTALQTIDLSKLDGTVEDQTFYSCSSLLAANLAGVTDIGEYAFADCRSLAYLSIPDVCRIGQGAFARYSDAAPAITGTDGTMVLTLPATLTELGDGVFAGCEQLTEVVFLSAPAGCDYLFVSCPKLTSVTLPDSMKRIGVYMFADCPELVTINLACVEEIGEYAFTSCQILSSVRLDAAKKIGFGAFASTSLSGGVSAPDLTEIGDYAFQNTNLSFFVAPNLETIGIAAFQNNKLLSTFTFGKNIRKVGDLAFLGCSSMLNFLGTTDGGETSADTRINDYARVIGGVLYTTLENGQLVLSAVPAGMRIDTLEVAEGTIRITLYAGCENEFVKKIVLPETLKLIGNYAFYGYKALEEVEFRSFLAPTLESSNLHGTVLTEDDPGFSLLHNQFDIFGLELCYYTFVDLAGKGEPIRMILPANPDAEGYDGIIYEACFGAADAAQRSTYVAKEKKMTDFVAYAQKVKEIRRVALTDEELINNAIASLNAMTQNPTDFGYSADEWQEMVTCVTEAKARLTALKLANASQKVRDVQAMIDALPDTYTHELKDTMAALAAEIAALTPQNRALLTQAKYNALLDAFRADEKAEEEPPEEDEPVTPEEPEKTPDESGLPAYAIVLIVTGSVLLVAGGSSAAILLCKKKKKRPAPAEEKGDEQK